MKRFLKEKKLLAGMGMFFAAAPVLGLPAYTEETVEGHRCVVVAPEDLPSDAPVVLILHGFGTNGEELLYFCDELGLPPCLFVLPDAPLHAARFPNIDHAWYDRFTHDRKDIESSREYLFAVMDHFSKEYPDPEGAGKPRKPRPVIILGFSQGAVMSLEAGVNYKGRIAAVVSMSGYMGEPEKTLAHPSAPRKTPILLVAGSLDPVVQLETAHETAEALRRAGYHPVLKEIPIGHHITRSSIDEVAGFLQDVLGRKR